MLSKMNENVITAYKKGYRIVNGEIVYKQNKINGKLGRNGYRLIGIRNELGARVNVGVHRLMAYQKYGDEIFKKGIQVRHYDGDKLNNLDENILIGTCSDNQMDIKQSVRIERAIRASSFSKKYDHEEIIRFYKEGNSYNKIMKKFGIKSKGAVSFIIRKSLSSK